MKITNKILESFLLSLSLITGLNTTLLDAAPKKAPAKKSVPKKAVKKLLPKKLPPKNLCRKRYTPVKNFRKNITSSIVRSHELKEEPLMTRPEVQMKPVESTKTPIETAEFNNIMLQIASINERFTAMGGYRSSARKLAITQLLTQIGTPVASKIYQDMKASGQL